MHGNQSFKDIRDTTLQIVKLDLIEVVVAIVAVVLTRHHTLSQDQIQ